jgi:hypothetical protein
MKFTGINTSIAGTVQKGNKLFRKLQKLHFKTVVVTLVEPANFISPDLLKDIIFFFIPDSCGIKQTCMLQFYDVLKQPIRKPFAKKMGVEAGPVLDKCVNKFIKRRVHSKDAV